MRMGLLSRIDGQLPSPDRCVGVAMRVESEATFVVQRLPNRSSENKIPSRRNLIMALVGHAGTHGPASSLPDGDCLRNAHYPFPHSNPHNSSIVGAHDQCLSTPCCREEQ